MSIAWPDRTQAYLSQQNEEWDLYDACLNGNLAIIPFLTPIRSIMRGSLGLGSITPVLWRPFFVCASDAPNTCVGAHTLCASANATSFVHLCGPETPADLLPTPRVSSRRMRETGTDGQPNRRPHSVRFEEM